MHAERLCHLARPLPPQWCPTAVTRKRAEAALELTTTTHWPQAFVPTGYRLPWWKPRSPADYSREEVRLILGDEGKWPGAGREATWRDLAPATARKALSKRTPPATAPTAAALPAPAPVERSSNQRKVSSRLTLKPPSSSSTIGARKPSTSRLMGSHHKRVQAAAPALVAAPPPAAASKSARRQRTMDERRGSKSLLHRLYHYSSKSPRNSSKSVTPAGPAYPPAMALAPAG
jgi:hypothetical protein